MAEPTIYVVEHDSLVREAVQAALASNQYKVEAYASPLGLLGRSDPLGHSCLVLGMPLPGMTGLELLEQLLDRGERHPFILIVHDADVTLAVDAMRHGAVDVLETPIDRERLLDSIRMAVASDRACLCQQQLVETLTPREKEIMNALLTGAHSKKIARQLGVSVKTIHVHQSHILKKMHVETVSELITRFK